MKIYNNNIAQNPGIKKQPAFGSAISSLSNKLLSGGKLSKLSSAMEYNGFAMSSATVLATLYIIIAQRYTQAYDKYDKQEILRRDLICLTALGLAARALAKGFSEICSKVSGFVLNTKPKGFKKPANKVWNYLNPESGFRPLNNNQIVAKYSKIHENKNGILDFCEFIDKKGGNLNKVLSSNATVKENTEKLLGKSIKDAKFSEIINSFKKGKGSEALKKIYKAFEANDNSFVRRAKTMNTTFGFVSTFLLTPALIIWISLSNEKMTKKRIEKELAQKQAQK